MICLGKTYSFEAAHSLPGHSVAGGKHGHSYRVTVVCSKGDVGRGELVIDDAELDELWAKKFGHCDYADLDEAMPVDFQPTSVENVAMWIFSVIDEALPVGLLDRVRVDETAQRFAEVQRDYGE